MQVCCQPHHIPPKFSGREGRSPREAEPRAGAQGGLSQHFDPLVFPICKVSIDTEVFARCFWSYKFTGVSAKRTLKIGAAFGPRTAAEHLGFDPGARAC